MLPEGAAGDGDFYAFVRVTEPAGGGSGVYEGAGEALDVVLAALASAGMRRPKTHLLASGGVLNYPQLGGEYARVGIALYGVLSARSDWNAAGIALRPVLTVKARVASVRTLRAGEGAGYDLAYVAAIGGALRR